MALVNRERLARIQATLRCSPVSAKASKDLCQTAAALRQALGIALEHWEALAGRQEGELGKGHLERLLCRSLFDETGEDYRADTADSTR